ncbi:MAG: hypothetical protein OEU09_08610, partial [Rhodospirillales bacterium]|nr:hypothetical protein [Rhodospirillales bacterium]
MLGTQGRSSLAMALLAATCLTPIAPAQAAPGDAVGGEVQVNTFTTNAQWDAAVAADADGDFVVAWTHGDVYTSSTAEVFAQRYDASGAPQGPEFQLNSFTTDRQWAPAVAMNADGDFVVVWTSEGQGELPGGFGIFAKRFDAAGLAQGPEFQVDTYTQAWQTFPAVAMDADGNFVVAWESLNQDPSGYGVYAQRYDAAGAAQGSEFRVSTSTTYSQRLPSVAMDADGDFVVAWESWHPDGPYYDASNIFAQRFDAAGAAQGPEFQVNSFTTGFQNLPAVAMDADGDFVVTWNSRYQDGDSWGVFAQRFDAAGVAQGAEFQVNTYASWFQAIPAVAMDADGDFVVSWQSDGQDGSGAGVFAQRFDATGAAQGPEFQVNTFTTGSQNVPAVAMDADGDFVVAWSGFGPGDSSYGGVFAQRFQGEGPVAGDFTVDGRADILWRNTTTGNALLWRMDGFAKEAKGSIGAPSTDWQVRGLADFNADTKTDVLWRNTVTGKAVVWLMDGFTKLAGRGIGGAGLDWQIVGTGDFDGDDHADILWRNTTTGATVIWQMDGLSKTAGGGIGGVPPVWEVAGVGDFDADARSDILWRNMSTGATVIWL